MSRQAPSNERAGIATAVAILGRSQRVIRKMAAAGELPAALVGKRWTFDIAQLRGFVRHAARGRELKLSAPTGRTFAEIVDAWRPFIERNVAATTVKRYEASLRQLRPFLDGIHLNQVDGPLVAEIVRRRQMLRLRNASIRRDLTALSSVIKYAVNQGWCADDPVLPHMKALRERRDPIVLPDIKDVQLVLAHASGMFAKLIEAAAKTGARQEELASARCKQVDPTRGTLEVIGKGNRRRTIDLRPLGAFDAIVSLPLAPAEAWLFRDKSGSRFLHVASQFSRLVGKVAEIAHASGKQFRRFRFHDLRHLYAVTWLKSGRGLYTLQHQLGHRSIATTEIYLQFLPADQARAVKDGAKPGSG